MATRPPLARHVNDRLAALIQEASCSHAGLARRVNMVGAQHGLDLRYDKTSVARWLRGQQPRGKAPEVIAEALGRKLGRPVTVDDLGMARGSDNESSTGLRFASSLPGALDTAYELWRADAAGRILPSGRMVTASALVEPSRDWLISLADQRVARDGGKEQRIGPADVAALEATTDALAALDHRFGSGNLRPVVVHYLDSVVSRLLAGSYTESTGRLLFAAAARLTALAGCMAVDDGRPALAQRYYIQALRLSQAASDRAFGGYVLAAGMSHLAGELGSPREITQLARTAQEGAKGCVTPRTSALFHAAEARGHAVLGDDRACRLSADRALADLERAENTNGPEGAPDTDPRWITYFDRAYLADQLAHCHRDLGQPAEVVRRAEEALASLPADHVRRRAIDLLLLAEARLRLGELPHACATATSAVQLSAGLRSRLARSYLDAFAGQLAAHREEPVVRDFHAGLRDVVTR